MSVFRLGLVPVVLSGCLAAGAPPMPGGSGNGSGTSSSPGDTSPVTGSDGGVTLPAQGPSAGTTPGTGAGTPPTSPSGSDAGAPSSTGLHVDLTQTSVSGFSSGAFMAVQFHVAYSSTLKGAAIFAGGPYDCAGGSASTAEGTCLTGSPDVASLVSVTNQNFSAGTIDDPKNLASEKVFLFGGADDSVVHPTVVDATNAYYQAFMPAASIHYESRHAGASHTMPTVSYGGSCDTVASPYVGDCNYDGAGNALSQIYGTLAPKATTLSGKMNSFSQSTFVPNAATVGFAPTGYYYVPASCANGETCKVHVSFHGCEQNAALVEDAYYGHAGYNEWADTNHIIVLYPQATSSNDNDYECWDFWGYDGASYAEKSGTQVAAVYSMIKWIAAGATGGTSAGGGSDAGVGLPGFSLDAGSLGEAMCITASNTAQVAAGRATATGGYAYAVGSDMFLGADNSSTQSSLEELTAGYYTLCL